MKNRGIIKISGTDAKKFLQSLITNDINLVSSDSPIYSLLLSPQGRYLHDFFISISEDVYILDIILSAKNDFIALIKKYILRSDVVINDITDQCSFIYSGQMLNLPNILCQYRDPRFGELGFRVIINGDKDDAGSVEYIEDKYEYAIPDTLDLIYNRSMPQEYGLDILHGISYNKGCYVGQELISRTKSQGVIRKKIYKVFSDSSLEHLKQGDVIIAADEAIGFLCSSYKNCGIALIRLEDYAKFSQMNLTINTISVSLSLPDWQK